MQRKLRMGMVGGGKGGFIGAVHRMAANLDGKIELVAGCFSSDPAKSKASGEELFLDPARVYETYEEMAQQEAALPADQRIDFVSIVTRNNTHKAVAETFLKAGFHVLCDKPLAFNLDEGLALRETQRQSGRLFCLTHNYTGYPMVKHARAMVANGELGDILKIVVEYPQGYAISNVTTPAEKQQISSWRADPNVAGAANCTGDIGTHAHNLMRYITGMEIDELCAELTAFIPGAELDDDSNMLVRFKNGARGILYASQISNGDENNLNIRIYGTKKSLEWYQENPNDLWVKNHGEPKQMYRRGNPYVDENGQKYTRTPFAHPEGFIEAFANVYLAFAEAVSDDLAGKRQESYDFPTIDDGVAGMAFIKTAVESSKNGAVWTKMPEV